MRRKAPSFKFIEVPTERGSVSVPTVIEHSSRSRKIGLTLTLQNHARLVVPNRCSTREAIRFMLSQGDWLHEQRSRFQAPPKLVDYLKDNPWVSLDGEWCPVEVREVPGMAQVFYDSLQERVFLLVDSENTSEAKLVAALKQFAKHTLSRRTWTLAEEVGASLKRVSVRDQSTRWGSCSETKTVSLNWRLILIEPELQDYVIYHELAHLKRMDHSPAFWRLTEKYDPNALAHDEAVSEKAREIMALGRG